MSFQISLPPHKRAAARFVGSVSRMLQKVLSEEEAKRGLKQADIARVIGVDRATITRQIHGAQNMTLARVAELAFAMGRKAEIHFVEPHFISGSNTSTDGPKRTETSDSSADPSGYVPGLRAAE